MKGDWAVLEADQLLQVNLDVQVASQAILGSLPEIKGLRERMVKELPAFDVVQFDKLEDYVPRFGLRSVALRNGHAAGRRLANSVH